MPFDIITIDAVDGVITIRPGDVQRRHPFDGKGSPWWEQQIEVRHSKVLPVTIYRWRESESDPWTSELQQRSPNVSESGIDRWLDTVAVAVSIINGGLKVAPDEQ